MKRLLSSILILLFTGLGWTTFGQDLQETLRFAREAAIVNDDGTFSRIKTSPGNLSMAFTVSADGDAAKVRTNAQETINIVIRVYDTTASPQESIVAFKMKSKPGKNRKAFLGAWGVKSKDVIAFDADIWSDGFIVLTFHDLEPGEYGLWLFKDAMERNTMGAHQMVFFGVD